MTVKIKDVTSGYIKEIEALKAHVEQLEMCLKDRKNLCRQAFDTNDALKAERDALAARIQTAERIEKIFSETPELAFDDCLKLFADEIRNVQAEAGRAGFLAGYNECWRQSFGTVAPEYATAHSADQYAATVRQGIA